MLQLIDKGIKTVIITTFYMLRILSRFVEYIKGPKISVLEMNTRNQ